MQASPAIRSSSQRALPSPAAGFALIAVITMMALVVVVTLGLLALSAAATRQQSSIRETLLARSNARLAMQLALGRLQLLSGQDTRVTASSRLVSPEGVMATGAWRSWEGNDRDSGGKPVPPDYGVKRQPGRPEEAVGSPGSGRFLGWLVSTATTVKPEAGEVPEASITRGDGRVPLVSSSSVTERKDEVYLRPTLLEEQRSSVAWWVSGDNAKAMVNGDRAKKPDGPVAWQQRVRSNGRADPKAFGLEAVDALPMGKMVPSDGNLALVGKSPGSVSRKFHDLTSYSRGLLTNTANGGWRKDLSLMTENYGSLPSSGLPFLTIKPGQIGSAAKASPSAHPPGAILYPWATYRSDPTKSGWAQVPPICSWDALVDYSQQYRDLASSGAARTAMPMFIGRCYTPEQRYDFQDQVRRCPQIARIHWIYSMCSVAATVADGADKVGQYKPALMVTPVLTLWNPYNVELSVSSFGINIQETAPLRFKFKVGGQVFREASLSDISKAGTGYQRFFLRIDQPITLAPGASRIFSLTDKQPKPDALASHIALAPGYTPGGGYLFFYLNPDTPAQPVFAGAGDVFSIDKISYDAWTNEGGKTGLGIIYDIYVNGLSESAHRMIYDVTELGGAGVVDKLYPPLTTRLATTVGEVEGFKNRPFASAIFGYRMASAMPGDQKHNHLYSKGMLQANPLCYYTEIGFGDNNNAITSMAGTGVYHPINAPYDFAFQDVDGWNDTVAIPQWESGSGSSYIVSGLAPSDGLTRCVMAELPTRPLQSLADLQHFDARNNNPITPFQFNLIGNGSANPIFAPNQVSVKTSYNDGMCNDDCYLLNNLFFDDWFVSSIAPDLKDFGASIRRPMDRVYQDHLEGKTPLPNRFYLPAREARLPNAAEAAAAALATGKDKKADKFSFETIASKLEVEGMFNVNSTSVEAWKSLLRQGRNVEMPYLSPNGTTGSDRSRSFSYPRTSIAGDQGSDSGSSDSGSSFAAAAEFAGHRVLTDAQIDALAEEIVKQVKKRGPFLSLSEFVNRQLTGNKDLAIAATIQKALDNLAEAGSSAQNPFAVLQANSVHITSPPPGTTDYKFPEAALGWSAFGVPGWVRQADILRPLAPVLSARDDTFTIRAYGDSRDRLHPERILARAWCEVVVRRTGDFLDNQDDPNVTPQSSGMKSSINRLFGRRYEVVSFRWLAPDEV